MTKTIEQLQPLEPSLAQRYLDRALEGGRFARSNGWPCTPPYAVEAMCAQFVHGWHETDHQLRHERLAP